MLEASSPWANVDSGTIDKDQQADPTDLCVYTGLG
jgi:hypothetical protein